MIGPDVGSCGTAAFTQQQVIVSNIAADPLWTNYREIALKHDLHACWSAPIIAQDNVLGTFALYYRTPRRPSEHDQQLIGIWPKLVALAISRKRTEEALLKSEERFNLAVAGSNDGLWDWDIRSNEVYYSPRFKELLGYGDHEFENVFASFETNLHPVDREPTLAKVRRHLDDGESYDVEYRLRTKCGEYRWFRARGQAVWDNAGRAVRMAGSLTDLMKQKQEEAVLERYTAEIQRANETLRIAEAEARKAVVKRDQFLAMLSHELRNPLSAIMSGIGVLDHTDADHETVTRARQKFGDRSTICRGCWTTCSTSPVSRRARSTSVRRCVGSERIDFRRRTSHATGNGSAFGSSFGHSSARAGDGGGRSNAFAANS